MGSTDRRFDKPVIEAVLGTSHDAGTPQGTEGSGAGAADTSILKR
jgi:hypothetical protein